jgi:tRNA nucleotidyltransferase/poly(A) polymerase
MSRGPPKGNREFALSVVHRLREAGHEALWAGGCVRDQLLGEQPLDYDVATSATPDDVRRLFGRRQTVSVGAAFGVILVVGPRQAGQVEVATFRRDAPYSDGRHPDSVTFSSAEEDAKRRDFTINGLFYDPVAEEVIDYVGGRADLQRGLVRAIGDPYERIREDKLRMLRAVRFAAKFNFDLDAHTLQAVADNAAEITLVSVERIADEMRKTLVLPHRVRAVRLLLITGLLSRVLPEIVSLGPVTSVLENNRITESADLSPAWQRVLAVLEELAEPVFPQVLAAMLREVDTVPNGARPLVHTVCRRWRLTVDEIKQTTFLVENESRVRRATEEPWPQLQRLLVTDGIDLLLDLAEAIGRVVDGNTRGITYCREKLQLPAEELNPPALITGDDLIALGLPPGKAFKLLLDAVRDAQLLGELRDKPQALDMAKRLWEQHRG